jgi:hypothetical protein
MEEANSTGTSRAYLLPRLRPLTLAVRGHRASHRTNARVSESVRDTHGHCSNNIIIYYFSAILIHSVPLTLS